jgi:hypothetical protein
LSGNSLLLSWVDFLSGNLKGDGSNPLLSSWFSSVRPFFY